MCFCRLNLAGTGTMPRHEHMVLGFKLSHQCVPELPVETPLLPGSLSLSEVAELQTHSDEQLEEGHDSQ